MEHILKTRKLYVLSGLPGSGKSTLLSKIPSEFILSADAIREQIYGVKHEYHDGVRREYLFGWDTNNVATFEILHKALHERMREQLTTFVDATNLNDTDRKSFFDIAKSYGMEAELLILDVPLETAISRDASRLRHVGSKAITQMNEIFVRSSTYPYTILQDGDTLSLVPEMLSNDKIDIVSDVHGLYDDFKFLIEDAGYSIDARGVPVHPEGRTLLFLGDVVDRGRQSIEMLQFVRKAVEMGGHHFILGNHEDKLLKVYDFFTKKGVLEPRSLSGAETLNELLKLNGDDQIKLMDFLRKQKAYYLIESYGQKFAVGHADITSFDPLVTPKSSVLYGDSDHGKRDSDHDYQIGFDNGLNKYHYIRGHIKQITEQPKVRSLEYDQAFGGSLALLKLDNYALSISKGVSEAHAFNNSVLFKQCDFNYNTIINEQFQMLIELRKLQENKLVQSAVNPANGLSLYKYSKQVFFDGLWDEHPLLLKARGLVLDVAGNIVQHPFDKIFNYGERNTALDLPDNTEVEAIEKLNGFLGCITKDPYSNNLLVTTTGSFDSPFVKYIESFITPQLRGKLLHHFSKTDETLMFEVIHPEDNEHPIKYDVNQQGLWLIGAREKHSHSQLKSESYLDDLGNSLNLHRPKHHRTTLGEVREWVDNSSQKN